MTIVEVSWLDPQYKGKEGFKATYISIPANIKSNNRVLIEAIEIAIKHHGALRSTAGARIVE